jgi:4-amino-4-deoxy-L-arabinose transferase-like glycosyltransferase
VWVETGLLATSLLGLVVLGRRAAANGAAPLAQRPPPWDVPPWLAPATLIVVAAAGAAFASGLAQHPHGEWDAWMDWNLKSRMFFRGGAAWRSAFSPEIPWSHPDYPLVVPALVARAWLFVGRETQLGPAVVAGTFTFGTLLLLGAGLAALHGTAAALLAMIVLASTPFFIVHGTSFYADVPVATFFLAALVCLALDARHSGTARFAVMAGVAAGLSVWTKNEGLLFTLAIGAALLLDTFRSGGRPRGRVMAFAAGALPFVLLTVSQKMAFAPPNDLLSTLSVSHTLGNLTSGSRYYVTLREYALHIAGFGSNGIGSATWLLVAFLLGTGVTRSAVDRRWGGTMALALTLVMLGHFGVFVSMAHELERLLASSLDRLLLQLWPSALFLFFLLVRTPGDEWAAPVTATTAPPGTENDR